MFRLRRDESMLGEPLTELAGHLLAAAEQLGAALSPDQDARQRAVRAIQGSDRAAEAAAHAVLRSLAASFVTPFDRADVFRLTWALRRATARIHAAADCLEVLLVAELPPRAGDLVQIIVRAAEVIGACVPRLGDPAPLSARWIDLTVLVKRAGQAHRRLLLDVTSTVTDQAALVRTVEIVSALRRVVDALDAVGDAIETVVVTES